MDQKEATIDDWEAVLSGRADPETVARYTRTMENETSDLHIFVRGLQRNTSSLLSHALDANGRKKRSRTNG